MGTQEITLRVSAECPDLAPLWDSVILQNAPLDIDWQLAGADEGVNVGGLQSKHALYTAIILCIWSNKWTDENEIGASQDRKGWWGDGVDRQGFPELGSKMHSLFRGRLNNETAMKAKLYIEQCLQTLIDQGAVARFAVNVQTQVQFGTLKIEIDGFSESGQRVYEARWRFVWDQITA